MMSVWSFICKNIAGSACFYSSLLQAIVIRVAGKVKSQSTQYFLKHKVLEICVAEIRFMSAEV